jgi:hypothetical protein
MMKARSLLESMTVSKIGRASDRKFQSLIMSRGWRTVPVQMPNLRPDGAMVLTTVLTQGQCYCREDSDEHFEM